MTARFHYAFIFTLLTLSLFTPLAQAICTDGQPSGLGNLPVPEHCSPDQGGNGGDGFDGFSPGDNGGDAGIGNIDPTIVTNGDILGGIGGSGGDSLGPGQGGNGGTGGAGVTQFVNDSTVFTGSFDTIRGGAGGNGGESPSQGGNGGLGGNGISQFGDNVFVLNNGSTVGNSGGHGGNNGITAGNGNAGGTGIFQSGNHSSIINNFFIGGGSGGHAGDNSLINGTAGAGGNGIQQIGNQSSLLNNGVVAGNNAGHSGHGFVEGGNGANGGSALLQSGDDLSVTNNFLMTGGNGSNGADSNIVGVGGDGGIGGYGINQNGNNILDTNIGIISGGIGGDGGFGGPAGGTGGAGANGLSGITQVGDNNSVVSQGAILGGLGGFGGSATANIGLGGDGGAGNYGISQFGDNTSITNFQLILGGVGGDGGDGGVVTGAGGNGGLGTAGVLQIGANTILINHENGVIAGGDGGFGGLGNTGGSNGAAGGDGARIFGTIGGTITNDGIMAGGFGGDGVGTGNGGNGGDGIILQNTGALIINNGRAFGGDGGLGVVAGFDGYGIHLIGSNSSIINSGFVSGGGANPALGTAIAFDSGTFQHQLTLNTTSEIIGNVSANSAGDDTLILQGTGTGSIDLGNYLNFDHFNMNSSLATWNILGTTGTIGEEATVTAGNLMLLGTMTVNGSHTLTVKNTGTLSGNGFLLSNAVINSGGTLAPSDLNNPFTINNDLTFDNGALYSILINNQGQATKTQVNGNLTIQPTANVIVNAVSGLYQPGITYTILTNTGSQTGTFAGATANFIFLAPILSYTPSSVLLSLNRVKNFASIAQTVNQTNVANALDNIYANSPNLLTSTFNSATSLADALEALTLLAGDEFPAMVNVIEQQGILLNSTINDRLNWLAFTEALIAADPSWTRPFTQSYQTAQYQNQSWNNSHRGLMGPDDYFFHAAASDTPQNLPMIPLGNDLWVSGIFDEGQIFHNNRLGTAKVNSTTQSYVIGYDHLFLSHLRLGAAFAYDTAHLHFVDRFAHGKVHGKQGALYAAFTPDPYYVNLIAAYGRWHDATKRSISIFNLSGDTHADFDSKGLNTYAETGIKVFLSEYNSLVPFAGIQYGRYNQDEFTESGDVNFNLHLNDHHQSSTTGAIGLRYLFNGHIDEHALNWQAQFNYQHRFNGITQQLNAAFATALGSPYTVFGTAASENAWQLSSGGEFQLTENFSIFADAGKVVGDHSRDYRILGGINYNL